MGLSEAQVESFDVEGILAAAEEVISNAGSLRLAAFPPPRDRLPMAAVSEDVKWDGKRFQTPLRACPAST